MKFIFLTLASIFIIYSCTNNQQSENDVDIKAVQLIKILDSGTLTFLKSWNYTNRMSYYNIWTKVKEYDSLTYSFLYEPRGDTTNIEIYDVANFLKDYKTSFTFDTSTYKFYRLEKINNNITGIYPNGRISGNKNLVNAPISIDSVFKEIDPFSELEQIDHYKDKFNFNYYTYIPSKGNYIRFAFSNSDEDILYYVPDDLIINDKNLFPWVDKFSKGKRLDKNWILVKNDRYE
jgi:hypothetical protein